MPNLGNYYIYTSSLALQTLKAERRKNIWDYLIIAFFTALVILAAKFLNWVWLEPRRIEKLLRKQGLNGTSYRFLYGDANEISNMYKEAYSKTLDPKDDILPRIMPFIKKSVETYGKISFAWIGPKPRIIISDVELIKTVLNKYKNFQKSFGTSGKIISLAVGGLGHYEGEKWNKSRVKLNPAFHVDKLKQKIPGIQECVDNIINQWRGMVPNDGSSSIVDVTDYLEDLSGSTVTQTLFSTPYSAKIRTTFNYLRDITILTNTATKPFNLPGIWYLPTKRKRKALAMEKQVRELFTFMINERLSRKNKGKQGGQDILDLFLDELYTENISSKRVRAEIIEDAIAQCKMFYFAGFDTTSNLLVWILVMLASHQNWQARAREEVFEVLGNTNGITNGTLNHLKIISMILFEVLRLYPPVMELSRVVDEETELGGYQIPKGVSLQLTIGMLQRSTEIWGDDAHEFNPNRFSEGMLKATNGQVGFMPFSRGPRICIGQNFALMEAKIFVAQFLRAFSFELSPTYKHAPNAAFTVQPEYGAPLVLRKL